jgi:hypothetical protein
MQWNPMVGHVPRGFCGAIGNNVDVKVILVCAEPGDPHPEECHEADGTAEGRLDSACHYAWECFAHGKDQFHRNIRNILDMIWPELSFREQMNKTWITDSVLCSAKTEGGSIPRKVVQECTKRYLKNQIMMFANAKVVALGKKAQSRLMQANITDFIPAYAAAPPGCNFRGAKESWQYVASVLKKHYDEINLPPVSKG